MNIMGIVNPMEIKERLDGNSTFINIAGRETYEQLEQNLQLEILKRNEWERPDDEDDLEEHYRQRKFRTMKISSIKELLEVIPTFSGDDAVNVDYWLYKYEEIAKNCNWSDLQKVMYCKRLLRGSAKTFIRLEKCCFSWKQLRSSLQKKFSRDLDIAKKQGPKLRLDEISKEYNFLSRRTRMSSSSSSESLCQNKDNSIENKLIPKNSLTVKELKEKFAYYDCTTMLYDLKLHDNAHREKQAARASGSQDMK